MLLVISRPDPVEWPAIRAKWTVEKEAMGKRFAPDFKPFARRKDAEKQAEANARSEMFDVLRGHKPASLEDFGL